MEESAPQEPRLALPELSSPCPLPHDSKKFWKFPSPNSPAKPNVNPTVITEMDSTHLPPPQRPSGADTLHKAALVTRTVRKWAADHNQENATTNEAVAGPDGSLLSSGMPSHLIAENLIHKGLKRRLPLGQSPAQFYNSITHLHLDGQGLTGNVEPIKLCLNLKVLYLFDNKLSSLSGLGSLNRLTHLYAQNNHLESLHDFTAPPALQQLFLNG